MRLGPDDRVRPVEGFGGRLWEVIGTFEKTKGGPRERQRRYLVRHPLRTAPRQWPEFDDARLSIVWEGYLCEFEPRRTSQYLLLKLLAERRGGWVDYATIGDRILGNPLAKAATVRQLKRRLVVTLQQAGLDELAAAITASRNEEGLKLDL